MSAVLQHAPILTPADSRAPATPGVGKTLRWKLYGLVILAVLVMVAIQAWSAYRERALLLEAKRTEISSVAEGARAIVDHFYQQQKAGSTSQQAAQEAARVALQGFRYGGAAGNSEYLLIIDSTGTILMHGATASLVGSNSIANSGDKRDPVVATKERMDAVKAGGGKLFLPVTVAVPGHTGRVSKLMIYTVHEPWGWIIGTGVIVSDLEQAIRAAIVKGALTTLIAALALLGAGTLIARRVIAQIGAEPAVIIDVMGHMAKGDLGRPLPPAAPGSVLAGLANMAASVRELISRVRDEAGAMKQDAQRIAETVDQVSHASSRQSDATSSMAAAVEELTVSVAHISDAADQTQRNSEGVAEKCRDGEARVMSAADGMKRIAAAVGEASDKIRGLEARALQINSIAASIKEIAGQTNLLALNAAIEAARAGEQGRGFSVVADEVRKLAERTSSATVEIEEMVGAVQRETSESTATMGHILPMVSEGTELADQVAVSLREISHSADTSLDRVREVAHATREQSSASTSIAQQVESIAQMVEETTAAMGETAKSAQEMRAMAERLDSLVGAFRV